MTPLGQATTRATSTSRSSWLSMKSKYIRVDSPLPSLPGARRDLCPEKVSDYIRLRETLSVRPIFGPSYCSHTATTTATKAATTIKAFLSSRPGWLASVPERGRESDEAKACVSKWLLHQMGTTWTFRTRCGNGPKTWEEVTVLIPNGRLI